MHNVQCYQKSMNPSIQSMISIALLLPKMYLAFTTYSENTHRHESNIHNIQSAFKQVYEPIYKIKMFNLQHYAPRPPIYTLCRITPTLSQGHVSGGSQTYL